MDDKTVIQIAGLILGATGTVVLGLISKGISSLVSKTLDNTTELKIMSATLKAVVDETKSIPKMKEDINYLHRWRRKLTGEENREEE